MRQTRVVVTHYGGPDALRVFEAERPEPRAGEVRVKVMAAGVPLPDIMAREGTHPQNAPAAVHPWVRSGRRALIHGASGGVGTALLPLGRLAGLDMYGTCSPREAQAVTDLGGVPIDYRNQDFVKVLLRLTDEVVDVVFYPIGGSQLWHSRQALRPGGRVAGYGLITTIRGEGLASRRSGRRHRFRGTAIFALYIAGGWMFHGGKRVVPHSIRTLKRLKAAWFREDLVVSLALLHQRKIKPLIARRLPLAEARQAQEELRQSGVIGKIVLVSKGSSLEAGAA